MSLQSLDLSHWDTVDEFTIAEVVGLAVGYDPNTGVRLDDTTASRQKLFVHHFGEAYDSGLAWLSELATKLDKLSPETLASITNSTTPQLPVSGELPQEFREHIATLSAKIGKSGLVFDIYSSELFDEAYREGFRQRQVGIFKWAVVTVSGVLPRIMGPKDDSMFRRANIQEWLNYFGWRSAYEFQSKPQLDVESSSIVLKSNAAGAINGTRWPWGNHETELLSALAKVGERWWSLYDPQDSTTAPTNSAVSAWAQENLKLSKNMADAIASILRADEVPTGPRK